MFGPELTKSDEVRETARSMALRVVLGWIGVNLAGLLLLAMIDVLRTAASRLARLFGRTQPAEQGS
jgi:uncharacterized membrane protein (Fun14 family)